MKVATLNMGNDVFFRKVTGLREFRLVGANRLRESVSRVVGNNLFLRESPAGGGLILV